MFGFSKVYKKIHGKPPDNQNGQATYLMENSWVFASGMPRSNIKSKTPNRCHAAWRKIEQDVWPGYKISMHISS